MPRSAKHDNPAPKGAGPAKAGAAPAKAGTARARKARPLKRPTHGTAYEAIAVVDWLREDDTVTNDVTYHGYWRHLEDAAAAAVEGLKQLMADAERRPGMDMEWSAQVLQREFEGHQEWTTDFTIVALDDGQGGIALE